MGPFSEHSIFRLQVRNRYGLPIPLFDLNQISPATLESTAAEGGLLSSKTPFRRNAMSSPVRHWFFQGRFLIHGILSFHESHTLSTHSPFESGAKECCFHESHILSTRSVANSLSSFSLFSFEQRKRGSFAPVFLFQESLC